MRTYKSRLVCKNTPMFLRRLAPQTRKYEFRGNKFSTSCLVRRNKAVKNLRSSNNVYVEAKKKGLTVYSGIESYHSTIRPNRALDSTTGFSFGLELETVAKSPQIFSAIYDGRILNSNWIFCSRDGSLPYGAGVELATIPLPSAYALDLQLWKDTTKHLRQYLYAAPDPSCGLHVHVGTQHLLPIHPFYDKQKWDFIYKNIKNDLYDAMEQEPYRGSDDDVWRIPASLLISSICSITKYGDEPYPIQVHRSKLRDLHTLYCAIRDLSNVEHLPKVLVKYQHPQLDGRYAWVKTANCTSPGAHMVRAGVNLCKTSQKPLSTGISYTATPASHSTEDNSARHRLWEILNDAPSHLAGASVLRTGYITMAERSGFLGSRVNGLRVNSLLPKDLMVDDEVDDDPSSSMSPFFTALFGRNTQDYCGFVFPHPEQRNFEHVFRNQLIFNPAALYCPGDDISSFRQMLHDVVSMPIPAFATYLREEYGDRVPSNNLAPFVRHLLYATHNCRPSGYREHTTRYAAVSRLPEACTSFQAAINNTYIYLRDKAGYPPSILHRLIRLYAICYAYLYYHHADPQEYIDAITKTDRGSLPWILATMNLACTIFAVDRYSAPDTHSCELNHSRSTFELRRGKSTLNPNRIHSILTFVYYMSSAAAATHITPVNAPTIAKQLVRALVTQTHSPLLAHYAATCFPTSLTGLSESEALTRRAPVLADLN